MVGLGGSAGEPAVEGPRHEIVRCGRFEIFPDKSLPTLGAPGAPAFVAEDTKNLGRPLLARVAEPGIYPRSDALLRTRAMRGVSLMLPVHFGEAHWPGESGARMVTIVDRPPQGPYLSSENKKIAPMSAEDICQTVLLPIVRVLRQFAQRGLTHRAIRPDNIFPPAGDRKIALLGECVSTAAGSGQPAALDPIPMMMCDGDARGPGLIEDDLYALGATMLFLSLGHDPTGELDPEALLNAKMEAGSYAALLQGERSPRGFREPLRGLLVDDVRERWDFEDIERWISGTLRRSTNQTQEYKSDRSFSFAGVDHRSCRPLAHALGRNWDHAAEAIRSVAFDSWIKRGIADEALSVAVDDIIAAAGEKRAGGIHDAMMISRVCMMLDRTGPLRFEGRGFMPDGFGTALAGALVRSDDEAARRITGCLEAGLTEEWYTVRRKVGLGGGDGEANAFTRVVALLKQKGPGYGVERCLYELDPNVPCLSEVLENRPVFDLHELLVALDDIVKNKGRLTGLIDRHLAAFIAARMRKNLDQRLADIASATGDSPTAKLGMVRLLGTVQEINGPGKLVHLTQWIADDLRHLVAGFHGRTFRDKVVHQLDRVAASGSLARLYEILGSQKLKRQDENGYAMAMRKYAQAREQIDRLLSQKYQDDATKLGFSIAMGAGNLAIAAVVVALVLF